MRELLPEIASESFCLSCNRRKWAAIFEKQAERESRW